MSKPDYDDVLDQLVERALIDDHYDGAFESFCNGLLAAGLPLQRVHLAINTLHPLVASVDLTWHRDAELETQAHEHTPQLPDSWTSSPPFWMLSHQCVTLRADLRDPEVVARFPVFEQFRARGATDYYARLRPFGSEETVFETLDGVLLSWLTDAPDGFSDDDIAVLERMQRYLALVAKLSKREYAARNVVSAYLGHDAGRRVLDGQIRLGDVDRIPAVIWFSDMRESTSMAERMEVEAFLRAINAYFECTAGAVLAHGGEVLRFIGDSVLAVFPIGEAQAPRIAAERALAASREARRRLEDLNAQRVKAGDEPLAFGLGLHCGDLLYGNIGVQRRIEFSVIGRVANEVSRLETLTKSVAEPVLVSESFAELVDLPWRPVGRLPAKGVAEGLSAFAPPA